MDSFFGIGGPELVVILLLAGLIMGPERIRDVARYLGRLTAQLQAISREFARQLNSELDSVEGGAVRGSMEDMQELRREVQALRRELTAMPKTLARDGQRVLQESKEVVDEAMAEADDSVTSLPTPLEVPDDME